MKINQGYNQSPAKFRSLNMHLSELREYKRRLSRLIGVSLISILAASFLAWNVYDASQLQLKNCMEANNKMNIAASEALVAMNTRSRELNEILAGQRIDVDKALLAVQDLRTATGVLRAHLFDITGKE